MASYSGILGLGLVDMPACAGRVDQGQLAPRRVDVAFGQFAKVLARLRPAGYPDIDAALLSHPTTVRDIFFKRDLGTTKSQRVGRLIFLVHREAQGGGDCRRPCSRQDPGVPARQIERLVWLALFDHDTSRRLFRDQEAWSIPVDSGENITQTVDLKRGLECL